MADYLRVEDRDSSVEKSRLVDTLMGYILRDISKYGDRERVYLCIGEPQVPGDSVGPVVGNLLKMNGCNAVGSIEEPVNAKNLAEVIGKLNGENKEIICIDAALAISGNTGDIKVEHSGMIPSYFNNNLKVGDVAIKGITRQLFDADSSIISDQAARIAYILLELERRLERIGK